MFFSPGDKVRLSNGQVGVWQSEKGSRFAVKVNGVGSGGGGMKRGDKVKFTNGKGETFTGEFVKRFSPARNAGPHYMVQVGNREAVVAVNSVAGKSMVKL